MNKTIEIIQNVYLNMGIDQSAVGLSAIVTTVCLCLMFMVLSYFLLSRIVEPLLNKLTYKTQVKWDDIVFRPKAMRWVWFLMPLIIGKLTIPASLSPYPTAQSVANVVFEIALVLALMMVVIEAIKSLFLLIADHDKIDEIAEQMHLAQLNGEEFEYRPSHSLKGLQQMLVIIVVALGAILCISILFGKNPIIVISGLGAAAAVLMLVFQDSILGVVAGIQLTANDMLQPGDWINASKYGANGIVQEVTLAAVKIRNWDQTISTIPPYKLLSEGFQNWRGMQLSKGRRIARSINIDLTSIRWSTDEEIALWSSKKWWKPKAVQESGKIVNLTAFRHFLEYYIVNVPTLRKNMMYMTRELEPTAEGLPVELYLFTSKIEWKIYESIQADIIDYVIATLPDFGLRVYQRPSGYDIAALQRSI